MLPSELLRIKIAGDRMIPKFAELSDENLYIADSLIDIYKSSIGKKVKELEEEVKEKEKEADFLGYDFKFFRGLKHLLDKKLIIEDQDSDIDPLRIRSMIFELSNELFQGASIGIERRIALKKLAEKLFIDEKKIEELFLSAFDEEKRIKGFQSIKAEDLLKEYNLSLLQTSIFKCKKLFLDLNLSGHEMRKLLYAIKRQGLLFIAEMGYKGINLAIDGPVSIIKHVERYGTRMAKLLPLIINAKDWYMRAYIKYKLGKKFHKTLRMDLDKASYANLFPSYNEKEISYDSIVEEDFSKRFFTVSEDWQIIREPEPIVKDNFIFIPDFLLVKGDKKVYFEIIGFWSEEYMKRKLEKIKRLKDLNLILAINSSLGNFKIDEPNISVIYFDKKISVIDVLNSLKKFS